MAAPSWDHIHVPSALSFMNYVSSALCFHFVVTSLTLLLADTVRPFSQCI